MPQLHQGRWDALCKREDPLYTEIAYMDTHRRGPCSFDGTHWSERHISGVSCHPRCFLTARLRSRVLRVHKPLQSALGADQLAWLLNDLARVNRAVTPWVTVSWHQPPVRSAPPFQSSSALSDLPYTVYLRSCGPHHLASASLCTHIAYGIDFHPGCVCTVCPTCLYPCWVCKHLGGLCA